MKPIFVIVHEYEVKDEHDFGLASSVKAFREIQAIKEEEDHRIIDGDPTIIPQNLPSPEKGRIYVCGSRIDICIPKQITALEKAGYNAEIYMPASIY